MVVLEIKDLKVELPAGVMVIATGLIAFTVALAKLLNTPSVDIETVNDVPSESAPLAVRPAEVAVRIRG